eukprot:CFRG0015T1
MTEQTVDQISHIMDSNPAITGVVATDNAGLCLDARGNLNARTGAYVASIVSRSRDLHPQSMSPVVSIESDTTTLIAKQHGEVIVSTCRQSA